MKGVLYAKLMWLWMKTAFDNIQSQRQILQEDISNKTNEMFNRNEIELKAKFTVVFYSHNTTTVDTESTEPGILLLLLRN